MQNPPIFLLKERNGNRYWNTELEWQTIDAAEPFSKPEKEQSGIPDGEWLEYRFHAVVPADQVR